MKGENKLVEQFIIGILQRSPRSFNELMESCHSLFPDELLVILSNMEDKGLINKNYDKYYLCGNKVDQWSSVQTEWQENLDKAYQVFSMIMDQIHLPHCLDYEWWFTHASREKLASKLINDNPLPLPDIIVFLASPLFGAFVSLLIPKTKVYILDKSNTTLETIDRCINNSNLKLVHYDAETPLPSELIGISQMVFFDPPWYVDYYDLFFLRSSQLIYGNYSTVTTVLFPVLTRPTSLQERRKVLIAAMDYGLSLVSVEPMVAHYFTPHFEYEALKKKGIQAKNWRKADLALFISDGSISHQNIPLGIERFKWKEILLGKVKVKIKIKDEESPETYVSPEIILSHDKDATLSSVSRRDPFRDEVDLWTSTHLGLKIKGWKTVWKIVEGMKNKKNIDQIVELVKSSFPADTIPENIHKDVASAWKQLHNFLN